MSKAPRHPAPALSAAALTCASVMSSVRLMMSLAYMLRVLSRSWYGSLLRRRALTWGRVRIGMGADECERVCVCARERERESVCVHVE
jgi:hypothetical protein